MHSPQPIDIGRWAATLRDQMSRSLGRQGHDVLSEEIDFWQDAIEGKYSEKPSDRVYAERIHDWYKAETAARWYRAKNWKVPPERTMLLQMFRNDPNYHLKNLVELVARTLLEETLKMEGMNVRVFRTSDCDDVAAWVDCIAQIRNPNGTLEHVGFDIAISDNPTYLTKKGLRTSTICHEFNASHGVKWTMRREVFSISPKSMARFLSECMDRVSSGNPINSPETVHAFLAIDKTVQEEKIAEKKMRNTIESKGSNALREAIRSRAHALIH